MQRFKAIFYTLSTITLVSIAFYYMVYMPSIGGYTIALQKTEIKKEYAPGDTISFKGVVTNTSKNLGKFIAEVKLNSVEKYRSSEMHLLAGEGQIFSFNAELSSAAAPTLKTLEILIYRETAFLGTRFLIHSAKENFYLKIPEAALPVAVASARSPKKYTDDKGRVLEFVLADFKANFPASASYGKPYQVVADIKNISKTKESFEVVLQILSPIGSKRDISHRVMLEPQERKQLHFVYNINENNPEGDYNLRTWYVTRQAKSEEVFKGEFNLVDKPPQISIKKMIVSPKHGDESEIIVEGLDDLGVKEVVFMAATSQGGRRSEFMNIDMRLLSGDSKNGLWVARYKPEKADSYIFAFSAVDTKGQKTKIGEFPIKVVR